VDDRDTRRRLGDAPEDMHRLPRAQTVLDQVLVALRPLLPQEPAVNIRLRYQQSRETKKQASSV